MKTKKHLRNAGIVLALLVLLLATMTRANSIATGGNVRNLTVSPGDGGGGSTGGGSIVATVHTGFAIEGGSAFGSNVEVMGGYVGQVLGEELALIKSSAQRSSLLSQIRKLKKKLRLAIRKKQKSKVKKLKKQIRILNSKLRNI